VPDWRRRPPTNVKWVSPRFAHAGRATHVEKRGKPCERQRAESSLFQPLSEVLLGLERMAGRALSPVHLGTPIRVCRGKPRGLKGDAGR
jgi:hypothetical protein